MYYVFVAIITIMLLAAIVIIDRFKFELKLFINKIYNSECLIMIDFLIFLMSLLALGCLFIRTLLNGLYEIPIIYVIPMLFSLKLFARLRYEPKDDVNIGGVSLSFHIISIILLIRGLIRCVY